MEIPGANVSQGHWTAVCKAAVTRHDTLHSHTYYVYRIVDSHFQFSLCLNSFNQPNLKPLKPWTPGTVATCAIDLSAALKAWSSTNAIHPGIFSSVQHANATTAVKRLCSSTSATLQSMLHPSTVSPAVGLSRAKMHCNNTSAILQYILHHSTVSPAIDPSAPSRRYSSTCITLPFTASTPKCPWTSSSAPSQHTTMTLPSRQPPRLPSCRDTRVGAVGRRRRSAGGRDTKMRWRANCTCGMAQRTT